MEIKIKDIQMKGPNKSICVVTYEGGEATMNTKWQTQEIDYLVKEVGIGGTVSCLIVQQGQYTNITMVDMKSGAKGIITEDLKVEDTDLNKLTKRMPQKKISMCAGEMLKCYYYQRKAEDLTEVYEAYQYFVMQLKKTIHNQ